MATDRPSDFKLSMGVVVKADRDWRDVGRPLSSNTFTIATFSSFFYNVFFYNCGLPLSHRKLCTTIRSYSVGGGSASIRKSKGTHNFLKVPQSKLWCPVCAPAAEKFWRRHWWNGVCNNFT